jgi:hypothetical protein
MWKNILELGGAQMKIWLMRIACRVPKAKYTYKKVNESRNRPGVAQRFPGGLGSQIS